MTVTTHTILVLIRSAEGFVDPIARRAQTRFRRKAARSTLFLVNADAGEELPVERVRCLETKRLQ
jgi:hypothetical protein